MHKPHGEHQHSVLARLNLSLRHFFAFVSIELQRWFIPRLLYDLQAEVIGHGYGAEAVWSRYVTLKTGVSIAQPLMPPAVACLL